MFLLKAKGAGHAAATGIHFAHFEARPFQQRDSRNRADQSFLMAVAVQERLAPVGSEAQRHFSRVSFLQKKFFQQEAVSRHKLGVVGT